MAEGDGFDGLVDARDDGATHLLLGTCRGGAGPGGGGTGGLLGGERRLQVGHHLTRGRGGGVKHEETQ